MSVEMLGDLYNWDDDRWKEMKANSEVLCKSYQCCDAECGC